MTKSVSRFRWVVAMGAVAFILLAGCGMLPIGKQDTAASGQPQAQTQPGTTAAADVPPQPAGGASAFAPPAQQTPGSSAPAVAAPPAAPAASRRAPAPAQAPVPAQAPARAATPQAPVPSAPPAYTPPPPPAPKVARLSAGTRLRVRTTTTISSKTHSAGDTFVATLDEPLSDNGWVVAPRGSRVMGRVAQVDAGGRVKGKATIQLELTSLSTADGQTIAIQTPGYTQEAKSAVKKDAMKVGIASGIGAAIGAIAGGGKGAAIGAGAGAAAGTGAVLATRGEPAVVPAETVLTFQLSAPVTITEKR